MPGLRFLDVSGGKVTRFGVGEPVVLRVFSPTGDIGAVGTVVASLTSTAGDVEDVVLTETAPESSLFEGLILAAQGTPVPQDGILSDNVGGSYQLAYTSPTNAAEVIATAAVGGSSIRFVDRLSRSAKVTLEGSVASLRVFDAGADVDPTNRDTTAVTLTSALTGDSEVLLLDETGSDRGLFAGSIALASGPAVAGNGVLETGWLAGPPVVFDTLTASHADGFGGSTALATTAGARIAFIDPYGRPATEALEGTPTVVRVEDPGLDLPGQADTASAELSTQNNGDLELLTLAEIADGSGLFEASLPIVFRGPPTPGDGVLESFGDPATARHDDVHGLPVSIEAEIVTGRTDALDAWGSPARRAPEGGRVFLRSYAWAHNVDPASVDSVWVWVDFANSIALAETGPDTGIFEGELPLDGIPVGQVIEFSGPGTDFAVEVASAQVSFLDLLDRATETYTLGATVRLGVAAPARNIDPAVAESLEITLANPALGFQVTLTASETAPDSGVFIAEAGSFLDEPPGSGDIMIAGAGDRAVGSFSAGGSTPETASATFLAHFAPLASDDSVTTAMETAVSVMVLANDSDPEGRPLSLLAAGGGDHGMASIGSDGTVTYTPAPGFFGSDAFTYVVADGDGGQARATVTVTVSESVEPPTAADDAFTLDEDSPLVLDVLANDVVSGIPDLGVVAPPSSGSLQQNFDDTFTYTPAPDFFGSDSFTYSVTNEAGSATAVVSLAVSPVNDPPIAGFVTYPATEGEVPLRVNFLAEHYSSDVDDGIASFSWDFDDGASANGSAASHTYTAAGVFVVTLTVTDFAGTSNTAEVVITVDEPERHAWLVVADAAQLGVGDASVRDRLLGLGYQVSVLSQGAAQSTDLSGVDLVLISSTVTSSQVNTEFRDVAVPVMTWEPFLADDLQMTGPVAHVDYGSTLDQTVVDVADAVHPLAAGLAGGPVSVLTAPGRVTWGAPAVTARVIATLAGDPSRAVIFAYESGQTMVAMDAPARRLGFLLNDTTAVDLTADGGRLFDTAVCWSVNCTGGPIVRLDAAPTAGSDPLTVTFSAMESSDGKYPIASFSWDFGDGSGGSGAFVEHSYAAGEYLAILTVTDEAGLSVSESVAISVAPASPGGQALFVAGGTDLGPADAALVSRLESLGFTVGVVAAAASNTSDADGKDLVLISSTVVSGQVATKFRDVAVPVLTWEAWLYDDFKMTPGGTNTGYGRIDGQSSVGVVDAGHPLAAGLSGSVGIVAGTSSMRWGAPAATASVVAVAEGDAAKALIFAYEAGAAMVGLVAPARRVGLPFFDDSAASFTAEGWALFDAAVAWATGH